MIDFLIIGQGIAGTLLADQLVKSGYSIRVLDDGTSNSSRVAAGLYNPVTGRKMVKTWKADDLFPSLEIYYETLETELGAKFLHKKRIYRPFISVSEQNDWEARKSDPKYSSYIFSVHKESNYPESVNDPFGGLELNFSGYLEINKLLDAYREQLIKKEWFAGEEFRSKDLEIQDDGFRWNGSLFSNIIFCDGIKSSDNSYFGWLPFQPLKGEILTIKMKADFQNIINRGVFVLGKGDDEFLVGSTYNWREPWSGVSEEGEKHIEGKA